MANPATPFTIKQGNTRPALRATLMAAAGGGEGLAGATVRFSMTSKAGVAINRAPVTIVTASAGIVEYAWSVADTNITPGAYAGEFEVTFGDGTIATYPNDGYISIRIVKGLLG